MVKKAVMEEPRVIGCRKAAQVSCKEGEFRDPYRDGYCQSKRTNRDRRIAQNRRARNDAKKAETKRLVSEHIDAIDEREF